LPNPPLIPGAENPKDTYPILFPVVDIFNHLFASKVSWTITAPASKDYSGSAFSLALNHSIPRGSQVYNNYAPKGNEELLVGYGFCLLDNPCDQVAMRLTKPADNVLNILCDKFPKLFADLQSGWKEDSGAFYLRGSGHYSGGHENLLGLSCLRGIPAQLFIMLNTIVEVAEPDEDEEDDEEAQERMWCTTLDAILQRLEQKQAMLARFGSLLAAKSPQNAKQMAAKIYRDGQVKIVDEIISELEKFLGPIEQGEISMTESFEVMRGRWQTLTHE
jgi:hypothetical protein